MANSYFQFKQFTVHQDQCAMKVTTDGCLFGAWIAERINSEKFITDSCLDIGTGTGLLSLMLVQKNPAIKIDAIEIDANAIEQAKANIAASPWSNNIQVLPADAREFVSSHQYDIIISNPPFYENELKGADSKKNLAHHDGSLRLPEVLAIIRKNLSPHGCFFLLLPFKRTKEVKELLLLHNFIIEEIVFAKQSERHDYFRILIRGKLNNGNTTSSETVINEITVSMNQRQYTPAFVLLLKDYYLHL
jgi:tRNA1Val (adenine37-N6)-methyltransferase